ncbi:hypothetical protein F1880_003704 [Penicillium rolfsii]|nr:hypothetical protein F1880_003704 [Penicillium rolfsii]
MCSPSRIPLVVLEIQKNPSSFLLGASARCSQTLRSIRTLFGHRRGDWISDARDTRSWNVVWDMQIPSLGMRTIAASLGEAPMTALPSAWLASNHTVCVAFVADIALRGMGGQLFEFDSLHCKFPLGYLELARSIW